jgi:hypothetical protein
MEPEEAAWVQEWNEKGSQDLPLHRPVAKLFLDMAFRKFGTAENPINDYEINDFRKLFFESQFESIDAFAARNNGIYDTMARVAVAAIVLLCERDERLEGDWCQKLWSAIFRNQDGYLKHGIRVISFNYDRSFERFFYRAFKAAFQTEMPRAEEYYSKLTIKHPYDYLGSLREHHYGKLAIGSAAGKIKMARGAGDTEQGWGEEFYEGVGAVTFIGFSFWPENLDVLRLGELAKHQPIFATACGLALPTKDDMEKLLPGINFGSDNERALEFVTRRRVFDFRL